jgi:hypothetical protein
MGKWMLKGQLNRHLLMTLNRIRVVKHKLERQLYQQSHHCYQLKEEAEARLEVAHC